MKITNKSPDALPINGVMVKPNDSTNADWGNLPDQHVLNAWHKHKLIAVTDEAPTPRHRSADNA